jgi:FkbM family methyltransferase
LTQFPKAQVYCFEPVDETYRLLQENIGKYENVRPFRLAFAAARGKDTMVLDGPSDRFYLLSGTNCQRVCDVRLEQVEVETIDEFCMNHGVSRINYLKVDTEGSDLKVLHGGKRMLAAHSIDIIEVEAGMNRGNKLHVPFVDFIDFFDRNDYFLFALYEQVHEWPTKEPHLRRTNPVFVSNSVIQSNRG